MLAREVIDLIVLDLSMPQPGGFEMLKRLRANRPGLPVVVASAFLEGPLLKAAEMFGATAVIAKADAPMLLLPVVQEVLQRFPPTSRVGKRARPL